MTAPTPGAACGVRASDVSVGAELPALEIPITTTLIVTGAIASRDFQSVHHDASIAKQSGAQDLFMNILTTGGLVSRFVTDWTGPETIVRAMSIRLGVPNYPGDVMTLTGHVSVIEGARVTVAIRGANRIGDHVSGTLTIELPGGINAGAGGASDAARADGSDA